MAKTDNPTNTQTSKKSNNRQQGKQEKQKPPTKIVIRHLPPTMTEEEFLKQIDPLPPHDVYYFAAADWSLGFDATCRAYITLKNYDDVFLFRDRFDGYVFVDAKGAEYAAIVEFAPFQGLAKNRSRRSDNKVSTIEEESHYQQFLVKLDEEREAAAKGGECKLEFNLNTKKEEITSTPLLQYLAIKKEKRRQDAKKRTEEKRRQREDDKDKRRLTVQDKGKQQQQQVTRILTVSATASVAEKKSIDAESKIEQKKVEDTVHEKQSSRNRRRIERNQKRHEAFAQRKNNERSAQSNREETENTNDAEKEKKMSDEKVEKSIETKQDQQQSAEKTEHKPAESRRERDRERERERNRMRREREREKQRAKEAARNEQRRNSGNERKLSDGVKDTPKLLVKNEVKDNNVPAATSTANEADNAKIKTDEDLKKQQRAAEERRIRNKDRPSIAIYQPKARLRQSEESDTGGNSTGAGGRQSDGERAADTIKGEEVQRPKKVSRYSERRNERRAVAKEKRRSSATDEEVVANQSKDNEPTTADNQ